MLQKAEVSILSQTECKKSYGPVSPRMLCAGVASGERDACRVSSHLNESHKNCLHFNLYVMYTFEHELIHQPLYSLFFVFYVDELHLRGTQGVLCPVRRQAGVAGSWLALSAGGRAAADQTYLGSTPRSTSSPPGFTAISTDMIKSLIHPLLAYVYIFCCSHQIIKSIIRYWCPL